MRNTIDITGVDLHEFVKVVYALSRPQGLGFLHFTPGELPDEEAARLVQQYATSQRIAIDLDYVNGRACKMAVFREQTALGERLYICDRWYGHTDTQLRELLDRFGLVKQQEVK